MSLEAEANVSPTAVAHNWNIIWKQHVPPRVCSLLWRMAHCCLPTRTHLIQKCLSIDDTCVHCDVMVESHIHSFFVCPKVMNWWEQVRLDDIVREFLCDVNDFRS